MCLIFTFAVEFYHFYSIIAICTFMCLFLCQKVNLKITFITITFTGLCAAIISLVRATFTQLLAFDGKEMCVENWPNDLFGIVYSSLTLLIDIKLPILILIINLVIRLICKCDKNAPASRLLIVVLIIFFLLWSPLTLLVNVYIMLPLNIPKTRYFLFILFRSISSLTVIFKPIVYYIMDQNFKLEIRELFLHYFKA